MESRLNPYPLLPQVRFLFFVSGFSALVLEVTDVVLLRYGVGNTAHAIAAVLCAFMGGLALGSWAAGKWLLRAKNLLALYGGMESLPGIFADPRVRAHMADGRHYLHPHPEKIGFTPLITPLLADGERGRA